MSNKSSLDVHLTRKAEESWGFRLIGGKDFNMPLTVVKVVPGSPADAAGLQNGDVVSRISDSDACDLSHSGAKEVVDSAEEMLALGVQRGLYDPVLDDYEPIYEPIDPEDFDQPSQPTEVQPFQIQQFLDPIQLPVELPELRDIETPGPDVTGMIDSRSITASPFILPTRPYRPFSTEPLPDIPSLEDPIILNPNYSDHFGTLQDGDVFPETRFKLPISEQYDPDGSKKRRQSMGKDATFSVQTRKEVTYEERVKEETKISKEMQHKTMVEEIKFMEKLKKDIDMEKIEMTAVNIVDESIERAVSVADEIKKEIALELSESESVATKVEESVSTNGTSTQNKSKLVVTDKAHSEIALMQASEIVEMIDKTTEAVASFNGSKSKVTVANQEQKIETNDKQVTIDERKLSAKKEIEETIVSGTVRIKSEAFDKKVKEKSVDTKQVEQKISTVQDKILTAEKDVKKQSVKVETASYSTQKSGQVKTETISTSQKGGPKSTTDSKTSQQRAYTIGLKTIPSIKGTIHSSYHYNLLLQTFFLHLTDVMVALSRFLLTERVFNKEESQKEDKDDSVTKYTTVQKEHVIEESFVDEVKEKQKESVIVEKQETKQVESVAREEEELLAVEDVVVKKQDIVAVAQEQLQGKIIEYAQAKNDIKEYLEVEEASETRMLSGAKMAQLTEKKSEELTHKMDAVITEFQVKAGIEETVEARERRSRSRSRIEEEVALESDPLEWLSKQETHSQEIREVKSETKSFSSETVKSKKVASEKEIRVSKTSKAEEGKQMYVAIVESHVFTNKDAIFEAQLQDFSETSSVQSADEINIALQASETVATEEVSLESMVVKQEKAESILEESRELAIVNARSETVEIAEEVKAIVEEVKEETALEVKNVQESEEVTHEKDESILEQSRELAIVNARSEAVEIAEEVKAIVEKVKKEKALEVTNVQEEIIQEIIQPVSEVQEIKKLEIEENTQKVEIKEEEHQLTVSEKEEVSVYEESHEIIQSREIKNEEKAAAIIEDINLETVESKEIVVEPVVEEVFTELHIKAKPAPTIGEASAELKIVKEQVLEVEQTLKLIEESDVLINKQTEIHELRNQISAMQKTTMESNESTQMVRESFIAKSLDDRKKLSLDIVTAEQRRLQSQSSFVNDPPSTIATPTPSTIPPTPLTDEYVFKLKATVPKGLTPVPREISPEVEEPEDEDPNIVKKKLVPHIDTFLESPIIYDPPLPSPSFDKVQSPMYTKPGLRGGSGVPLFYRRKEEILEIERKSSLLASAIDETIKSIEEYKEEVGLDTKKTGLDEVIIMDDYKPKETKKLDEVIFVEEYKPKETNNLDEVIFMEDYKPKETNKLDEFIVIEDYKPKETNNTEPIIYNGHAKVEMKAFNSVSKTEDEWNKIDKQVTENNERLKDLTACVNGFANEETHTKMQATSEKSSTQVKKTFVTENNIKTNLDNAHTDGTIKNFEVISNGVDLDQTSESSTNDFVIPFPLKTAAIIDTSLARYLKDEIEDKIEEKQETKEVVKTEEIITKKEVVEQKKDPLEGYRPVQFNPEELIAARRGLQSIHLQVKAPMQRESSPSYMDASGELLGTHQGIVDGLEEAVVDADVAKELGKPGITEEKIAVLISGESEMLREAHVMGLSRVLSSHMHRPDDSSVDFKKIKPIIESLKDSEVLKALNDELIKTQEEKKKEERKWTTFLQKPKRPVPRAKFGYFGYKEQEEEVIEEPYKVKIVKQPKPKVAPDYKPKVFETGPLPWEERALNEPPPPPVDAEDPILIPEELPEFLEAVDPLPESEIPDLEETGIPLPPPKTEEPEATSNQEEELEQPVEEQPFVEEPAEEVVEVKEEPESTAEMEQNSLAEQLMNGVQNMVDPNASVDQQLAQMRAQLAALAQLPGVIQHTLELVTKQLCQLSEQETHQTVSETVTDVQEVAEESVEVSQPQTNGDVTEVAQKSPEVYVEEAKEPIVEETKPAAGETKSTLTQEEIGRMKREEEEMLEEQRRIEKQKKELMEQMRLEQESRQVKQRSTPRVGKPRPVFGPPVPQERPLVLPGGRKWRKPQDAYNEQFIAETLTAQAEIIQGKAKGINFMKYEKPPVSLDHLQQSETYKLVHNMEQKPLKQVETLTPVIAEADYREKCRSMTPSIDNHMSYPQQVHP